ncbi:MAG: hypothetical protein HGA22_08185 [Clostridiales bacterium]|nr:hypothetical protein [Clostridiales bacterium]
MLSLFVCIINLLTDLLYGLIDPRIKARYKSGKRSRRSRAALDAKGGCGTDAG